MVISLVTSSLIGLSRLAGEQHRPCYVLYILLSCYSAFCLFDSIHRYHFPEVGFRNTVICYLFFFCCPVDSTTDMFFNFLIFKCFRSMSENSIE